MILKLIQYHLYFKTLTPLKQNFTLHTSLLTQNLKLRLPLSYGKIHVLSVRFGLEHGKKVVSAPFVLPLYHLQNEILHDRCTFKVLHISPTTSTSK